MMEKMCINCQFEDLKGSEEPCDTCNLIDKSGKCNWQPKDNQPHQFKVGDKARVVEDSGNLIYKNGEIVEVIAITPLGVCAKAGNRDEQHFLSCHLEPFAGFQVGDRVRIVKGGGVFPLLGFDDGEVVIIQEINPPHHLQAKYRIAHLQYNLPSGYCNDENLSPVIGEPRDGMDMVAAFAKLLLHDRNLLESFVKQVEDACEEVCEKIAELLAMSDFCISKIPYFEGIEAIWSDRMTASEEKMFLGRLQPYREAVKKELGEGYIPAIKLCRQMTGWDLKRAKELVDQLKEEADHVQENSPNSPGGDDSPAG